MLLEKKVRNSALLGGILGVIATFFFLSKFDGMPIMKNCRLGSPFPKPKGWLDDLRAVKRVKGLIKR